MKNLYIVAVSYQVKTLWTLKYVYSDLEGDRNCN
jgi:hypothetical protein